MNRTRLTFFAVLAVILAIVATSVVSNALTSAALFQIFIACTIFAMGVVALDFMGILGQGEHGDADGDVSLHIDGDSGFDAAGALDMDGGIDGDISLDVSSMDIDGIDINGDVGDGADAMDGHDMDGDTFGDHTAGHLSDLDTRHGSRILALLSSLRMIVYFCLGFGPTGLMGILTGRSALTSLLLAIPVGVVALFLAQAFFRFQRSDTDSSLRQIDLLREQATVTVPLTHKTMGKVRIQIGMNVTEQYALAADDGCEYAKGNTVRIVRVTDECVFVA